MPLETAISYGAHRLGISLPVPQEQVKDTIARLVITLENIRQAEEAVKALVEIVQDGCSHPDTITGNHMGRWPYTKCTICGKEW